MMEAHKPQNKHDGDSQTSKQTPRWRLTNLKIDTMMEAHKLQNKHHDGGLIQETNADMISID